MKTLLRDLCQACSVAGHNDTSAELVRELVSPFCDRTERDEFGNVVGIRYGTSGKTVLLDAHMDVIGLQVKGFREDGGIEVIGVGGIDPRILPCSEVIVHGKKPLYGVIGAKPPHLLKNGEEKEGLKLAHMTVDVGRKDPQKLVRIGDPVTFLPVFRELGQGRISSHGLDNQCGVAVALYAMQSLQASPHTLIFLASTAEELGCLGAAAAMERYCADLAIVIDVTFGMTPDEKKELCFPLGSGVALCTGPNIHPVYWKHAVELAKRNRIPYTIEVEGGDTGTNAGVIQLSGMGVPCLLLSIPLLYMHTMVETVDLADMKAAANLAVALAGGELLC